MNKEQCKASVIIQARMGSSRLPGKVMMKVLGKPLIGHMIDRLKSAQMIDRIIVATSIDDSNNSLCDYLRNTGTVVFRGSENDVLARFYEAARTNKLKHIVRVTADCPLIDPSIVDEFVAEYFARKADYVCGTKRLTEGLDTEVFSFKVLVQAYRCASKKSEREHVTLFVHNNPQLFKIYMVENNTDDSKYRITVDEQADFEVVKNIMTALYTSQDDIYGIDEIKRYLDQHPEVYVLNNSIVRNEGLLKSLAEDEK